MQPKDNIDRAGAAMLVLLSMLLGLNQVVIKVVNAGFQPVFFAGLRSAGAALCILLWLGLRRERLMLARSTWGAGLLIGAVFAAEFLCLFMALDFTTVTRATVIFYSMPLWLAVAAHFVLPGERINARRALGLVLAFCGVAWTIAGHGGGGGGAASLRGDLLALAGAVGWAGIALIARLSRLSAASPATQMFWQVAVSAVVLLALAPLFGPLIRDFRPVHLWGLGFQTVAIAAFGFGSWMWLLKVYPAARVASFSFLTPMFGVGFGWLLLDEPVGPAILGPLALVAAGIYLINRRTGIQVPQNV